MTELEQRVAAMELLWIECGAWMDPAVLEDAALSIKAGVEGGCERERAVRLQALSLIDDAQKRFVLFTPGSRL